jgi:uncharacterized protein YebE (UPF0316 family)
MLSPILGALLIFGLRIIDVAIGTLRMLYAVRGRRIVAATLGAVEAFIFIYAIAHVFRNLDNHYNKVGYALGYACGSMLGITIEKWIASGSLLARIIARDNAGPLCDALRQAHFGVTTLKGEGRGGQVTILFLVLPRKRAKELLQLVQQLDADAFVTLEPINHAAGGYLPLSPAPVSVRK